MKSNKEIRKETRELLLAGWFGRIFVAFAALYAVALIVSGVVTFLFHDMEVQTWGDFLSAKLQHAMQGLYYTVPSMSAAVKMSGATLFSQFISYLFGAILAFGLAALALKAARNDESGWFKSAFGGFSRPFGLLWLLVRMNIQVFLWSLLFVIPGIVAAYRYRLAWFMKSDNPDWSAGRCLAESGAKMQGVKWQAFCLDLSYIWWLCLFGVAAGAVAPMGTSFASTFGNGVVGILVTVGMLLVFAVMLFAFIRLVLGLLAARAVFYRALDRQP